METKRLKFTDDCRPKDNDLVMLCTKKGYIWCGVVRYSKTSLCISMFVNDVETSGVVSIDNVRWWHLLPLTKEELYSGQAYI